ncbi:type II secretion system protein F [Betaproteobacteria bacterium]|nr:type II secretion system protein F [Betaproteobacteria bacterium]GHU41177.1 type II secretion system protein F [Betaproteobacteria bacterium]
MATKSKAANRVKEYTFIWEGKNREGKRVNGETHASTETVAQSTLRRQGITVSKIKKQRYQTGKKITEKDITMFTRQLATMMKAGVPLLQAFDIVGRGHANPSVGRLLLDIKSEVETGNSLSTAFRKYPLYFDALFCNLVQAGEQGGILDALLERLAEYKEKMLAIKSKIKAALFYPIAIIAVAVVVTVVIMLFVIPAFKEIFTDFGAELPLPTQIVIGISDFFVEYWWIVIPVPVAAIWFFLYTWKRSETMQMVMDRYLLRVPVFGDLVRKSTIARWNRTLATMFAAGVPLVESLDSVGGASGNYVYKVATHRIRNDVSTGMSLTSSVQSTNLFPNMVTQMISIGEESGALEDMLGKIADFYEDEVDDAIAALSSLMEPMIMVVLGVVIGGLVVAMYMPIFKLGAVV